VIDTLFRDELIAAINDLLRKPKAPPAPPMQTDAPSEARLRKLAQDRASNQRRKMSAEQHQERHRELNRAYHERNRETINARVRERRKQQREEVV
jgi:hypothetical protein